MSKIRFAKLIILKPDFHPWQAVLNLTGQMHISGFNIIPTTTERLGHCGEVK